MKILITGATGFVGKKLVNYLLKEEKATIKVLTRNKNKAKPKFPSSVEIYEWDVNNSSIDEDAIKGTDIIVNLAGENVGEKRWSKKRKKQLQDSRIKTTELLVKKCIELDSIPKKFISASAIGFYGSSDTETFKEGDPPGQDFLAELCIDWENAAKVEEINPIIFRIGLVLGKDGGALEKIIPIFKTGLGGTLGSGHQFMSWIHIDDLVRQIHFLIYDKNHEHLFNAVAPEAVTNKEFTKTLGSLLGRPTILPAPSFGLKLALGEMSALLLNGQNVIPHEFMKHGFEFKFETLEAALADIVK